MILSVDNIFEPRLVTNRSREACVAAYDEFVGLSMQSIRSLHVILCVGGVFSSSLFIFVLLSSSSRNLHINLRLSLASLSFAAFIACAQLLFTALRGFLLTLTMDDHCNALMDSKSCAVLRWPVVLAIYSTLAGIISLAVERTIATIRYRTYEVHGSRCVAATLISIQWSVSLLISFYSLFLRTKPGDVSYCTVYVTYPHSAVLSLSIMCTLELVILAYFGALLSINKRKQVNEFVNNALHSLTERYQLMENVRIMNILIPSVALHAVLTLLGLGGFLCFSLANSTSSLFAPSSELVLLACPIYACTLPLAAVAWNVQMRSAMRGALPCLFPPPPSTPPPLLPSLLTSRPSKEMERESERHFGLLEKMWKK